MPTAPVLIVAAGEPAPPAMLRAQAARCAAIYACDSAAATVLAAGLRPDLVVGDMDSLTVTLPAGTARAALAEQETTDLEKAFYTALQHGYDSVVVLGAGGRRWDHFHANLSIFARYAARLRIEAGDAYGWLTTLPVGPWCPLGSPPGAIVSLLPLPTADGVTTRGLRWPLVAATLALDGRGGTSNEAIAESAAVRYEAGCLASYRPAPGT